MEQSLPLTMALMMTVATATLPVDASPELLPNESRPVPAQSIETIPILAGVKPRPTQVPTGSAPRIDTARQNRLVWQIDPAGASYAWVRWHLDQRTLPSPDAFQISGMANAFDDLHPEPPAYDLGLSAEVFPSPTRPGFYILSLAVRAADHPDQDRGTHFIAVVEATEAAIPRIRDALRKLGNMLRSHDRLSIVAHGPQGRMTLGPTRGADVERIDQAIEAVRPGNPDPVAGLQLGYGVAATTSADHPGQVLLFSDGTGIDAAGETIFEDLRHQAQKGHTLSVVGFPTPRGSERAPSGYDHRLMVRLAQAGGGRYTIVDNRATARRLFSQLPNSRVVAREVSGRVELSPEAVSHFRVLGRPWQPAIETPTVGQTFTAGSRATALLELQLTGRSGPLGAIRVRYRSARDRVIKQLEVVVAPPNRPTGRSSHPSPRGLRPWIAATFGEKLSGSYWTRDVSYGRLLRSFRALDAEVRTDPRTAELRYLIQQARRLESLRLSPEIPRTDLDKPRTRDPFARLRVLE